MSHTAADHRPFLVSLVLLAVFLGGCGESRKAEADNPANAPKAAVVKVERRNLAVTLEIASEFLPYQEVDVYAKVSGYIQKLYVNWGDHVKEGQLLAVLEIPELQQQLAQDEANVRRSDQDLARAHEEQSRAESAYNVAHITYTRLADVQKSRPELVAQQEIDVAQGKDLEANAAVSSAKDALAAAEQALLSFKAALDRDKALFAYARMTAPFDSVVTQIYNYTGALLPAGTSGGKGDAALCHLSQNNLLRLVIPVPERAVSDIHVGDSLEVDVSGLKKTFTGKIVLFSEQIDPATRTMHTEVSVPNAKYEIIPGMYANVKIPIHTATNVLAVPVQAIQSTGIGQGIVLVVNGTNHLERREVKLGLESADYAEVLSGINENEMVVFGEQNQFREGQLISPQIVTAPGAE
ncbi:MAG: efflux RND transporter periplasmic adaptor subunit [Candidatus Acidiferrales bacterium]